MFNRELIDSFNKLRYQLYTDDIRNSLGKRTRFRNRFRTTQGKLLILLRVCNFLERLQMPLISHLPFRLFRYLCMKKLYQVQACLLVEISHHTKIGVGLYLPHPNGVIIHPNTVIGNNCMILQQVTIGNNIAKGKDNLAVIGDNVMIGAGAKIIGPCKIGNNVVIGANAVVTKDVPNNSVVGGIPAKLISHNVPPPHNGHYVSYDEFIAQSR